VISFCESFYFPIPVLVQTTLNVICDSDVQRGAMFVGKNVKPVVVVAYSSQKESEMFESLASCFAFRCSASLNITKSNASTILPAPLSAEFAHQVRRFINHFRSDIERRAETD